jgi:hypothetical protein
VAVAEVELTRDALIVHVQGSVRTLGKEVRFVLD